VGLDGKVMHSQCTAGKVEQQQLKSRRGGKEELQQPILINHGDAGLLKGEQVTKVNEVNK
jgi:hypothetical protein